jgi:5-methylcytosine-specific restriction endonuclease McrA
MMIRRTNTDRYGRDWSEVIKIEVWEKGKTIPNYPPDTWRVDPCGNVLQFEEHGNRDSKFGWEIDHIVPVSKGGADDLSNLQPLHWANNARKGDMVDWKYG